MRVCVGVCYTFSPPFFRRRNNPPCDLSHQKIIKAYANQKGIAENSFRLMYDGTRVNAQDTPKTLEMQDDDQVDAIVEQLGGDFLLR